MTALTVAPPAPLPAALARPAPLLPNTMREAMDLAEFMATSKTVPMHLQKSPADCLQVILLAIRWQIDPFAIAQSTSLIHGRLMYEGKLTMAVVNTSPRIRGRLHFAYAGEKDDREVTCYGTLVGEAEPVSVNVRLRDARTDNKVWRTQPDQQLAYHSSRVWARRYVPELMLGIFGPEEMGSADTPLYDIPPAPLPEIDRVPERQPPTLEVKGPPGFGSVFFNKTGPGIVELLKYLEKADAGIVLHNLELLSTIGTTMPKHAAMVSEIRANASRQLAARDMPETTGNEDESDDVPDDIDDEGVRRQVAQGARPPGMTDAEASNLPE